MPLRDPQGRWYGAALSGFGIIFNREVIKRQNLPEPKSWDDMADAKFRNWVACGDPRKSGSVHMMYELIVQSYGWDAGYARICEIAGNTKVFTEGASDIPKEVANGNVACGSAIDFYAWGKIATVGEEKLGFVVPAGRSIISADPVAVLKGAPQREAAEEFVRFVLSEAGQKLWYLDVGAPGGPKCETLGRLPMIEEFYRKYSRMSSVKFNPFEWGSGMSFDSRKSSLRWMALNELVGRCLIDNHQHAVKAWAALVEAGLPREARGRFGQCPAREEDLPRLEETFKKDPKEQNRILTEWSNSTREKFDDVLRMCGR